MAIGAKLGTIASSAVSFQNQYSFQFDGTNEYITIPNNTNLSFGNSITDSAFSVSCWVYCVDATRFRTLSKSTEWLHGPFGDDRLGLILIDSNTSNYIARTSNITIPQNVWVSIISTYDGSGLNTGIKHYINGAEPVSYNNLAAGSYTAMHGSTSDFYIGRDSDFGNHYANGNIDEAVVFNYELSAADAIAIYNNGAPADLSSLSPLSWWRMGDAATWNGSVWTLTDQGSGENNATSANMEEADRVTDVPI